MYFYGISQIPTLTLGEGNHSVPINLLYAVSAKEPTDINSYFETDGEAIHVNESGIFLVNTYGSVNLTAGAEHVDRISIRTNNTLTPGYETGFAWLEPRNPTSGVASSHNVLNLSDYGVIDSTLEVAVAQGQSCTLSLYFSQIIEFKKNLTQIHEFNLNA